MLQSEPAGEKPHAALLLLHGAGGSTGFWFERFAPLLTAAGIAAYAPHYFDRTGTARATREMILDGVHFNRWLTTAGDAVSYVAARPGVDARRIGILGVSLGGYLSMAMAAADRRVRAVAEVSGGMPSEWAPAISTATPPVLIVHGTEDTVVPVSEAYGLERLLTDRGVAHRVELLPGEGHWFTPAAVPRILGALSGFLEEYLVGAK